MVKVAKGTVLCFAMLAIIIGLAYTIQPPVVNSFMSFGDLTDGLIARASSVAAAGFALVYLVIESYQHKKGKNGKEK